MPVSIPREKELTLADLVDALRRGRGLIALIFSTAMIVALVLCVCSTRRYQATGTVQVEREGAESLSSDTLMGNAPASSDAEAADINIQTQVSILESNSLALRTIANLGLASTAEFSPRSGPIASLLHAAFSPAARNTEDAAAARQADLLRIFHHELTVKALPGTRLLQISYLSPDPRVAATVVNQLVKELIDFNFETRYRATQSASDALGKQLADLRVQSQQLQSQVADMQRQTGIYSIGMVDPQGRDQAYSAVLDEFQRAASAMNDAAQNRILKQAIYEAARTGDAELLSSLAGNTMSGAASSSITNALATVQNLRSQEAALEGELDQVKVRFGPAYPHRQELEAGIAGLEHSIQNETGRIRDRARSDYMVAGTTYDKAQQNYVERKSQADKVNDKTIAYMITRQEADESRTLYEDLLKRLKEAGILQGLRSDNISLVDPALVPAAPARPGRLLFLVCGAGGGLLLGLLAALLVDALDDGMHEVQPAESLGLSVVGLLPRRGTRSLLPAAPGSHYSDQVHAVRARLSAGHGQAAEIVGAARVIMVTCLTPGRGDDVVALNLGASYARAGKRVLLVEAHLRMPLLSRALMLDQSRGLSTLLADTGSAVAAQPCPGVPNLSVLPAGPAPAAPSELLDSLAFRSQLIGWRLEYDVILLAAPPALETADAQVLARAADLSIAVATMDVTTLGTLRRAHEVLSAATASPMTVLFSEVSAGSSAFCNFYGYSTATHATGEQPVYEMA